MVSFGVNAVKSCSKKTMPRCDVVSVRSNWCAWESHFCRVSLVGAASKSEYNTDGAAAPPPIAPAIFTRSTMLTIPSRLTSAGSAELFSYFDAFVFFSPTPWRCEYHFQNAGENRRRNQKPRLCYVAIRSPGRSRQTCDFI